MKVFIQIAWNNLLRNRRRTSVTLLSIVIGIAVMVFMNGFNDGMSLQWANRLINEDKGHLRIHHKDFYKFGISDMESIYIADPASLIKKLQKVPHVVAVMPRVSIVGLAGKDDNSTTFYGALSDINQIDVVLPDLGKKVVEGHPLSSNDPDGVIIGKELAKNIDAKVGDELVILSNTIYGDQSSALVHIRGLLETDTDLNANRRLILGALTGQMRDGLLDIGNGATELIVRLDNTRNVWEVANQLNQGFHKDNAPWVAEPWDSNEELKFLIGMFKGITIIIVIVLSLIVSFVISSTMMMSIFERIQEIGSMRAIGMEKRQVYLLFYLEYLLTISIGSIIGIAVGGLLIFIGSRTGVTIASGIFEGVIPVLEYRNLLCSFLIPLLIAAVVSLFPIRSSCRMNIVKSIHYK